MHTCQYDIFHIYTKKNGCKPQRKLSKTLKYSKHSFKINNRSSLVYENILGNLMVNTLSQQIRQRNHNMILKFSVHCQSVLRWALNFDLNEHRQGKKPGGLQKTCQPIACTGKRKTQLLKSIKSIIKRFKHRQEPIKIKKRSETFKIMVCYSIMYQ